MRDMIRHAIEQRRGGAAARDHRHRARALARLEATGEAARLKPKPVQR